MATVLHLALLVTVCSGLVTLLQLLNMAVAVVTRTRARMSLYPPMVFAAAVYLMGRI